MHNRRKLFFILMLVLIILTTSFVAAADNVADEGDETILSVSDDIVIDDNDEHNSVEKSSGSVLGLAKDVQSDENESEKNLTKNDAQLLGVSNDEDILSAYNRDLYSGTVSQIVEAIKDISINGGGTLFLHGGTYTGSYSNNQVTNIKGVTVCGGDSMGDGKFATLSNGIFGAGGPAMLLENWQLENVKFDSIRSHYGFLQLQGYSGSLTNVVVNNCNSSTQFITISGTSDQGKNGKAYPVKNWSL